MRRQSRRVEVGRKSRCRLSGRPARGPGGLGTRTAAVTTPLGNEGTLGAPERNGTAPALPNGGDPRSPWAASAGHYLCYSVSAGRRDEFMSPFFGIWRRWG